MPLQFYRMVSYQPEIDQIQDQRMIRSTNPTTRHATWFTTKRYDIPSDAQRELALRNPPTHRVGPIPADEMPDFEIGPRPIAPLGGQPGRGVEVMTRQAVYLFGVFDFTSTPPSNPWVL